MKIKPLHAWAIINREYITSAIFGTRRQAVAYMAEGSATEWKRLRQQGIQARKVIVRLAPTTRRTPKRGVK